MSASAFVESESQSSIAIDATPPVRIVLTGGPCGGKTTALSTLRDHLSRRGFHVILVPEAATHAFEAIGGYDPEWAGTKSHAEVQAAICKFQIAQEQLFRSLALQQRRKPVVMLCDRGTMDGAVFCNDEEWEQVLTLAD